MPYIEYSKNFDEIYEKRIEPFLKEIELQRLKKVKQHKLLSLPLYSICVAAALLTPLPVLTDPSRIIAIRLGMLVMAYCIPLWLLDTVFFSKLKKEIKTRFLPVILKSFGKFYVVNQDIVTLNDINQYKIFPFAKCKQNNDVIVGIYKGLDVYIQELKLFHGKDTIDFEGLIIKVKFPKKFTGKTIVRPDKAGVSAGNFQKVNLEDPDFEKIYDVYSTDQIEARYLLTTSFLERLKNLGEIFDNSIEYTKYYFNKPRCYCVFDKNYIMIFVNLPTNFFEFFSPWVTVLNKEKYKEVFYQMTLIFEIIHKLKIDLKIGL